MIVEIATLEMQVSINVVSIVESSLPDCVVLLQFIWYWNSSLLFEWKKFD